MGLKLQFAPICGALAVLAALCLAPSMAQAHAGHLHHAQPAATTAPQPVAVVTASATEQTDVTIANRSDIQAELKAADAGPAQSSSSGNCVSGCCAGMSCMTCIGLLVPSETFAAAGASPGSLLEFPDASARNGLGPDGLRRPPRSFV